MPPRAEQPPAGTEQRRRRQAEAGADSPVRTRRKRPPFEPVTIYFAGRPREARATPFVAPPRIPIDEARQVVLRNSAIADVSGVRNRFFDSPEVREAFEGTTAQPVDLILSQRLTMMQQPELAAFFEDMLSSGQMIDSMLTTIGKTGRRKAREAPQVDPRYSTEEDIVVSVLAEVFKDEKTLLPKLMDAVDARVARSSRENLLAIDEAEIFGRTVKKDVVLVGGGPVTALLANILSPYRNVTIITDEDELTSNWRNRPLFINSSANVTDPMARRVPLDGGTTTPVTPAQSANMPDTDILLNGNTFKVVCDDGTIREYPAGENLGNFTASVTALATGDYILNNTVLPEEVRVLKDGTKRLTLRDSKAGLTRELDADAVFFVTGPGKDVPRFEDKPSRDLYTNEERKLDAQIELKKQEINFIRSALANYRSLPATAEREKDIRRLERILAQTTIDLPKVLSLNMLQKIYGFWRYSQKLGSKAFPLKPLFDENVTIADIGGEDNTRTFEELVHGIGPRTAYPDRFRRKKPQYNPQTIIFNEDAQTVPEYQATNRRRYERVFTERTQAVDQKVKTLRLVDIGGKQKVAVATDDITVVTDYVFVGTGIEREAVEGKLPFSVGNIRDTEGFNVAKGNETVNVSVVGSAAGFTLQEYPRQIRAIIEELGIPPNSISLWVNALLAERYAWSWLKRNGIDKHKVEGLIHLSGKGKKKTAEEVLKEYETREQFRQITEQAQQLYDTFDAIAVDFVRDFVPMLSSGEGLTYSDVEGPLGTMSLLNLPPILRRERRIQLGTSPTQMVGYRVPYYMQGDADIPDEIREQLPDGRAVRLGETKSESGPGKDYIVIDGRIFRAVVTKLPGFSGKFEVGNTYEEITRQDPELVELLANIQAYVPVEEAPMNS